MDQWRPQPFRAEARTNGRSDEVIGRAIEIAQAIRNVNPALPPIFSLNHLAVLTDTSYSALREIVGRRRLDVYRTFRIRKRPDEHGRIRLRQIAVPYPLLMRVQRWITQAVLTKMPADAASVAFSKGDKLIDAAGPHCGCRWLIKLDLFNFFESIDEKAVYRVFRSMGYQPLVSFEMARICTRVVPRSLDPRPPPWRLGPRRTNKITAYAVSGWDYASKVGHLPQGSPSSPMLANLVVRQLDATIRAIASEYGLTYTRYADDLALSTTRTDFTRRLALEAIGRISHAVNRFGFSPNAAKTRIVPPRGRKIVLGLLVDSDMPRLSREFKATLRQHIHYITREDVGPIRHAQKRSFKSTEGFRNHLQGLLSFAHQIEPAYAENCEAKLAFVKWPP